MTKTFDVVIVGAGSIGLGIGFRAAQLGLRVALVDESFPGPGASQVAAGMLAPVTEAHFGEEKLLELLLRSSSMYSDFLEELRELSGQDIATVSGGALFVALDRDQTEALNRLYEFQSSLGLEVGRLDSAGARELEPALHVGARAAIHARGDSALDPRELCLAMKKAFDRSGGTSINGKAVQILSRGGKVEGVQLNGSETVSASQVVVAAGSWSGGIKGLPDSLHKAVRPVKGQIARLSLPPSDPPLITRVIRTEEMYLVPRRGREIVLGASMEEMGFDLRPTVGPIYELIRAATEAVPAIRELGIAQIEVGLRPTTPDNAPLIGPCSIDGLVIATGHGRNGILLTPVTAESVATMLVKGEVPAEIEGCDPERFAGQWT